MRDDCHVCGAKLARLAPSRHLRTVTCTSYPCAYIQPCATISPPSSPFIAQHHLASLSPLLAPVKRTPVNPVISRKLPPPSSLSLSLHSFPSPLPPPPFLFSPPGSYTPPPPPNLQRRQRQEREQQWEYHVSARDPILTFGHPISKCFPVAEEGGEVVPLILNCNVRFTSLSF